MWRRASGRRSNQFAIFQSWKLARKAGNPTTQPFL